jgi:hypothetical protein
MRSVPLILTALLFAACSEQTSAPPVATSETATPAAAAALGEAAPTAPPSEAVSAEPMEGWDNKATNLLGRPVPAFEFDKPGGGKMEASELRGHWTVLALWSASSPDSVADEDYIRAVDSAANQDPDLDFMSVHVKTDAAADPQKIFKGKPWPTVMADDKAMQTFGVATLPAYLLIGPDLTIEASRGALSKTPEAGIKDMFRGISEVRKQVGSPP